MKYEILRKKFKNTLVFDQKSIKIVDPSFNPKLLFDWQKKGLIKKIIRGKYIFCENELKDLEKYTIANLIYEPSYLSLESALSIYGIIPETVFAITSVSSNKTKVFYTDIGPFSYKRIKPSLFFGYTVINRAKICYRIADLEKALLDFLYLNPKIKTQQDFENTRLDLTLLQEELNQNKFLDYLARFSVKSLDKRAQNLLRSINNA